MVKVHGNFLLCSKIFRLLLLLMLLCVSAYHDGLLADTGDVKKQLFQKAQATFNQAQQLSGSERSQAMLKAASQFEALAREHHIKNGYLFYNIGNSYYEAGEKGKAILYYRRAERLIPGFSDLKFNLNTIKQELNTPESGETWWNDIVESVVFWHTMFDYSTRRFVSIVSFVLFWLVFTIMVFYKSSLLKAVAVLSAIVTIAMGGSFLMSAYKLNYQTSGVVIKQQTQVRKGPGTSYELIYEQPLSEGTEFNLLEVQSDWWKVKLHNGDEVWIRAIEAELI